MDEILLVIIFALARGATLTKDLRPSFDESDNT